MPLVALLLATVLIGSDADDALRLEAQQLLPLAVVVQEHFGNPDGVVRYHSRHVVRKWGCRIEIIDPGHPASAPKIVYENPRGAIFDMNLSFDAKTLFFSMREGEQDNWHLYEIGIDGGGLRQITSGPYHDFAPAELPSGDLVFVSTRVKSFNMCAWELSTSLFAVRRDGTRMRQVTMNTLNEFSPQILPDGTILYTRWEYVDRDVKWRQSLWTVNPDGTNVRLYAGNTRRDPAVFWQARPIPGSDAVTATFAPHHGWPMGAIGTVSNQRGPEAPRGSGFQWITQEYPRIEDNAGLTEWAYRDPFPLSASRFLVSYGGGLKNSDGRFKIYLLDNNDNKTLVHDDGRLSCTYPLPLVPKERPPIRAELLAAKGESTGEFVLQNVYAGLGPEVAHGEIKAIRIMEQAPKYPYNETGSGAFRVYEMDPVMGQRCYYVKRCLGTVPVEEDGSARFIVPAFCELYFQALDAQGRAVQSMGSAVNVVAGEKQGCIGCHDKRTHTVPTQTAMALNKPANVPTPYAWGNEGNIDFVKVVQPVLDKHCIACHSGAKLEGGLNLSGDKTRFFNMAYDDLFRRGAMHTIQLTANDSQVIPPKQAFSFASRLRPYVEASAKAHEAVLLSKEERERFYVWMDSNCNYYGTYARSRPGTRGSRDLWSGAWFQEQLLPLYAQSCAGCHPGLGAAGYPADSCWINLTHPAESLLLTAHLAKEAGGSGIDRRKEGKQPPRFASRSDAAYQAMLAAIEEGRREMLAHPRMDMPGAVAKIGPDDWGRWRGTAGGIEKTLVASGAAAVVRWHYTLEEPDAKDWFRTDYDDSAWQQGDAPFGAADPGIARAPRTTWTAKAIWMRRTIELYEADFDRAALMIHYDEDAEVYLNGILAARLPGYNAAYELRDILPEAKRALRAGRNTLAVHCRQTIGGQYIDLGIVLLVPQDNGKTPGRFWDQVEAGAGDPTAGHKDQP